MQNNKFLVILFKYSQLLMLALIIVFLSLTVDNFLTFDNITNVIMQQVPFLLIIAMGMTTAILTKGIDLSIAKKESTLVVIPADGKGIVPAIEKANDAGIPVINVNTKIDTADGCKVETFIAVENYTAAISVAEKLAEMLGEKGDVIILEGKAGASSSIDIVAGANDTFAKYSDINIVASQTASWSRAEALTVTQNLLQAHPDVNAIFAANDEMAMGAVEAVSQAGKEGSILITGLDANEDARKAVDEGKMAITCNKNGYGQGYEGIKAAVEVLKGGKLDEMIIVPTELYVK